MSIIRSQGRTGSTLRRDYRRLLGSNGTATSRSLAEWIAIGSDESVARRARKNPGLPLVDILGKPTRVVRTRLMPIAHTILMVGWGLIVSLTVVVYAEVVRHRRATGYDFRSRAGVRDFFILFALLVGSLGILNDRLGTQFVFLQRPDRLRATLAIAGAPIALWLLFDIPLRLARGYARSGRAKPIDRHPLDGAWAREASFLDRMLPPGRGPIDPAPDANPRRPPPLERVARLREVVPTDRDDDPHASITPT